ncbi:hypothetical protein SEPCBS119000_002403 [Sporothrix epigloea]|uniref:Uncharacterized protein n=1 Tax=Sporothrix epigloea TaxID=1892477 RepID=A0ABP0DG10_9PEZI
MAAAAVPPALLSDLWSARQCLDEHSYLFDKLRSRDMTVRRRLKRLAHINAELQQYGQQKEEEEAIVDLAADNDRKGAKGNEEIDKPSCCITRGQARELRRQMWWLQHQIQQVEQDEEQLFVRLGQVVADLQARQWLCQIRQQRYEQYGQQVEWLAQAADDEASSRDNGYSHGVSGHPCQTFAEAVPERAPEASQEAPTETTPPSLTVDSSFVADSPEMPILLDTTTASSASESAASAASVAGDHPCDIFSPLSPLAPAFEPQQSCTVDQAAVLASLGLHPAREETGEVIGDHVKEAAALDVTNLFVPAALQMRRKPHSHAASPAPLQPKRMSLPTVQFVWPENEQK